ncbi:hypothetical protein [Chondromyces crocatus]|uniref:Uncharacterized protein n=1 Tax=Chondromyces crocatus TaxID=52 RepID=A0A0K1ECS2_CHOCO|nr:hypothetical protein [Chondromyces crocatus]AKT38497.1 uncharacterized protein CMC5_026430 [Chondromyces crocatus]
MDLDIDCLREARVENVERLGRALGLRLPDKKRYDRRAYVRELVKTVMQGLRRDSRSKYYD